MPLAIPAAAAAAALTANPFKNFDLGVFHTSLKACGASDAALLQPFVASKDSCSSWLLESINLADRAAVCQELLSFQGERKGAPDEKSPGIAALKTLASVLNMAQAAYQHQQQLQQPQQQQQQPNLGLSFGAQTDPETAAKKAALDLLKSVGIAPAGSSLPMAIDQTGHSPFAQFNQVPGASWAGQTPPGQALGSAVLLAAQAQAQGLNPLSFALTPEPFLPASLPSSISNKLEKNEYIDFDEAFKTLTGSDTPVTDSSESKSEEAKKVRISYSATGSWCSPPSPFG